MTTPLTLSQLGWRPFFQQQLTLEEYEGTLFARIKEHHRSGFKLASELGDITLNASPSLPQITVGDWVLLDSDHHFIRSFDRLSEFSRKAAGSKVESQLIATNVDTAFIVSSLNHDFNLSRIERFLALANDAGVEPVIVLTKADQCSDPSEFIQQIHAIDSMLMVEPVNALDSVSVSALEPWCGTGKTIAFIGSSGVGKSTLINTLLGDDTQQTGGIRADDSKGKHTTTGRSLHVMPTGGLLLDTPGMRELQLTACAEGVAETFSDITELAKQCKFGDCQHQSEPKCAVQAAITSGELEERRLTNYQKLLREQARNGASLAERRANDKALHKYYKSVINENNSLKMK
ncbi:MAG: ribosome small subunit-dependent GTPase A [Aliivibrio sp.]|uniref:ribosome small subunit-dependent GTPase A n=1 Tax=Aliivibrio sp. TaxID=1872443 RepID=UPI001A3E40D1|nr:ribosome small subunit-dependent GTPase A [Aliivibrio sp.]